MSKEKNKTEDELISDTISIIRDKENLSDDIDILVGDVDNESSNWLHNIKKRDESGAS